MLEHGSSSLKNKKPMLKPARFKICPSRRSFTGHDDGRKGGDSGRRLVITALEIVTEIVITAL